MEIGFYRRNIYQIGPMTSSVARDSDNDDGSTRRPLVGGSRLDLLRWWQQRKKSPRFPGVMSRGREELKLVPAGCLSGHRLPTKVTCACCVIPLVYMDGWCFLFL